MTRTNGLMALALLCCSAVATASVAKPKAAPAPPGCSRSTKKCLVDIAVSGSPGSYIVTFNPDELHVKQSERRKTYLIVFRLPDTYKFKPAQGDGVFFKVDDKGEFHSGGPSDEEGNPASSASASKRYKWVYRNLVDGRYDYKVQFRDQAENVITGDPLITNIDTQ